MRIAQLTFNTYNNYGNILQKYALQKTLKKFTEFTEVLWFNANISGIQKAFCDFWVETAENMPSENLKYCMFEGVRISKLKEFQERYIKTRFNLPYIEETANDYDFFVIGSDQIWNPLCLKYEAPSFIRFLDFVPNEKKLLTRQVLPLKNFLKITSKLGERAFQTFHIFP